MTRQTEMVKKETQTLRAADKLPSVAPPVDVYENEDEILLVADVPGVIADGLKVDVDNGELLLEAPRTRGRRQGDPFGQLGHADACVRLKLAQNSQVGLVESHLRLPPLVALFHYDRCEY